MNNGNGLSYLQSLSIENCRPTSSWCPPANWEDVLTGERLTTNDVYTNDLSGERLIMENGDSLKINKEGKMLLTIADVCPKIDACDGAFRLTYPNGDRIFFDAKGLLSIIRGSQTVTFFHGVPTGITGRWLPDDRRTLNCILNSNDGMKYERRFQYEKH